MFFLKKEFIISFLVGFILFLIYSYRLNDAFVLTTDFGRDIYHSLRIAQGDIVLIGPKMNLGGYYSGPYIYYLFAPILLFGSYNISVLLYFHALLFSVSIGFFCWTIFKKYGLHKALLTSLAIGLLPFFILSARHPSNGYTYFPFLLILSTLILFYNFKKKTSLFLLGLLAGFIFNIHPISIFVLLPLAVYLFISLKKKKIFLLFLLGGIITLIPLALFEIKHDFVMTKDTFVNQSFNSFIASKSKPQLALNNSPTISIFLFISSKLKEFTLFEPLTLFALMFGVILLQFKFLKKIKMDLYFKRSLFLFVSSLLGLALLALILHTHYEDHYLFPLAFFIPFAAVLILLVSRFWILIFLIVFLEIMFFPKYLYQDSVKRFQDVESAVKYAVDNGLVNKKASFNLIEVSDAYALVTTGYDLRFFFRKYGFKPKSEYDYKTAEELLIFSETPYYDIDRFKMWATEEFGRKYFINREVYKSGDITIYKISKTDAI